MRKVTVFVLSLVLIASTAHAGARIVEVRDTPVGAAVLSAPGTVAEYSVADPAGDAIFAPILPKGLDLVTFNCENDNIIDPSTTLVLGPGDQAGVTFSAAGAPSPYVIKEVRVGLFDFNTTYPAELQLDIYEDDNAGSFQFLAGFTVEVVSLPALDGDIIAIDLSTFAVQANNDLLILYNDTTPTRNGLMLPAGDNSPRCFDGSNVCGVVLPNGSSQLFIYGVTDAVNCPAAPSTILLYDLVAEIDVDEVAVPVLPVSWGTVKSDFGK